jgi:hypothetical protein
VVRSTSDSISRYAAPIVRLGGPGIVTGGALIVGLREMLLDRTFQPRQHVVNLFDIPFSRDYAVPVDQPHIYSPIAQPGDRDAKPGVVDLFEFLFQRPHTFSFSQDSVSGLAPLNRPAIIETVKRG